MCGVGIVARGSDRIRPVDAVESRCSFVVEARWDLSFDFCWLALTASATPTSNAALARMDLPWNCDFHGTPSGWVVELTGARAAVGAARRPGLTSVIYPMRRTRAQ